MVVYTGMSDARDRVRRVCRRGRVPPEGHAAEELARLQVVDAAAYVVAPASSSG